VVCNGTISIINSIAGVEIDGLGVKFDSRAVLLMFEALVGLGLQLLSLFNGLG
jgi:hypothetical protein